MAGERQEAPCMSNGDLDLGALKQGGLMPQQQSGLFSVRLHIVGGRLTAEQLMVLAQAARSLGQGTVHLTARQGVEIPNVPRDKVEELREILSSCGLSIGVCGPRVRTVTACQGGGICRLALVETWNIASMLDEQCHGRDLPHKFKICVTGCPNNCLKVHENDLGLMGVVEPEREEENCDVCGVCEQVCPSGAIGSDGEIVWLERDRCEYCGECIAACPSDAWRRRRVGYRLFVGGKMGRRPQLAVPISPICEGPAEVLKAARAVLDFYDEHGGSSERFGETLNRTGVEGVAQAVRNAIEQ